MNNVSYLINVPFSSHSVEDKIRIKESGRPTPVQKLEHLCKDAQKERVRKLNPEINKNKEWLCGCDTRDALFCFPCLLFGGEIARTKTGVTDLKQIAD